MEPPRPLDGLRLALVSLGCYLLLAQEALHGNDAQVLVAFLAQGHLEHPYHLLYLRILGGLWALVEPLGLLPYEAITLGSALGTALGVLLLHRTGARLGLDRGEAVLLAAVGATAPAVVFFATVAEIHGVFFAFAGWAWLAWAGLLSRPTLARGALLGCVTGLAASVHATGHLLWGLLVLTYGARALVEGTASPRRQLALLGASLAAHLGLGFLLAWLLQPGWQEAPFQGQIGFFLDSITWLTSLGNLPGVVWHEWVVALLPWSVLCLLGFRRAGLLTAATLLSAAAYLLVAFVLLDDNVERGAYFLPFVLPLGLIALRLMPRPALLSACALSAAVAVAQVRVHDRPRGNPQFAAGLLEIAAKEDPMVLCLGLEELNPIARRAPSVPYVSLTSLLSRADEGPDAYPRFCAEFDAWIELLEGQDRTLFVTAAALDAMERSGEPLFERFAREHLPERYLMTRVERRGFAGYRLRLR